MSQHNYSQLPVFGQGVARIAVCFYGCYRTGDYCLPAYRALFDRLGIPVDYFCTVKDLDEYRTSHTVQGVTAQHTSQHITQRIHDLLDPVAVRVIDQQWESENYYRNHATACGMGEAIMLKQQHEATTGTDYDLVFVTRYDVLPQVNTKLKTILSRLNRLNWQNLHRIENTVGDTSGQFIITRRDIHNMDHTPLTPFAHDYFYYGTNHAVNMIGVEILYRGAQHPDAWATFYRLANFHALLDVTCRRLNIPVITDPDYAVEATIVRPFSDLNLPSHKLTSWQYHRNVFLGDGKFKRPTDGTK